MLDETTYQMLKGYGIDGKNGMTRCLDDETLYLRLLSMFIQDKAFSMAVTACQNNDYAALFEHLHDLKGISGNVGLTDLFGAVSPLVEVLRDKTPEENVVKAQFQKVDSAYTLACAGIRQLFAQTQNGIA